ncbi:decaprenyl-phosphate phosphoribosyltransferase [Aneurinibacillus tyrosinisolvens]|uniref:decaprenyl-phosphate phosphoribosyltransferase n=1 Tax=Aneurinibacillus tyrosinisolvens TaxID=1443435 RepID=UPI00063FB9C5|nr:decaprenyl-phosphate phosphoribosyltransferase [Aneurinibacillus tyrosinisolvens]
MSIPNESVEIRRKRALPFSQALMYFVQLRPRQWTKNLLVFAALIFSIKKSNVDMLLHSIIGFFLFCFVSSCVYILNDFVDREADRQHPEKRHRPMASGAINPYGALFLGAILLVFSLTTAFSFSPLFAVLLVVYFLLNVAYSFKLKHVVILDILIIASGFLFRAIGGGLVIGVQLTPWFLICTLLLSLFLAISKRRHELHLLEGNKGAHRKVLDSYSFDLLNQFNSIVTTATIMSYALFTFTSGHTIYLMWTLVFVLYGIFRYLYLIHMEDKGGKPEKVLFEDRHILVTVMLYAFSVVLILVYFE